MDNDTTTDSTGTFSALAGAIQQVDDDLQDEVAASAVAGRNYFVGKPSPTFIFSVIDEPPISIPLWRGKKDGCQISKIFTDEKKFLDSPFLPICDQHVLDDAELEPETNFHEYLMYAYAVFDPSAQGNIGAYGLWAIRLDYTANEWWTSARNTAKKLRGLDAWGQLRADKDSKGYELKTIEREDFPAPKTMPFTMLELMDKCFGSHLIVNSKEHRLVELLKDPFALAVPNAR